MRNNDAIASEHSRSYHIIGITGGIGVGKSTVGDAIGSRYPVLNSDDIAKEILDGDEIVQAQVREVFGAEVFMNDGKVNRPALASKAFESKRALESLNRIVHPTAIERIRREAESLSGEGARFVFVESALIYEARIEGEFDYIICVTAPDHVVVDRMSRVVTKSEIERRKALQLPQDKKARRADFVLKNDGSKEMLQKNALFIVRLIEELCREV